MPQREEEEQHAARRRDGHCARQAPDLARGGRDGEQHEDADGGREGQRVGKPVYGAVNEEQHGAQQGHPGLGGGVPT
ncbi:hypothetical protein OG422_30990 (plasmid) [Streptomyces sp. NBC_01525]|uniref:hypothetical protein n=1 Tax=Streptomyces sp. NBC_01525 TaxID=2903893 RepID=UPI002F9184FD